MLSGSTPPPNSALTSCSIVSRREHLGDALIKQIEARAKELAAVGPELLSGFDPAGDDWAAGWILQVLHRRQPEALAGLLPSSDQGWLLAESGVGLNYGPLQQELLHQNFEEADRITSQSLRELAGDAAEAGYVYFTVVPPMSGVDLVSLDRFRRCIPKAASASQPNRSCCQRWMVVTNVYGPGSVGNVMASGRVTRCVHLVD